MVKRRMPEDKTPERFKPRKWPIVTRGGGRELTINAYYNAAGKKVLRQNPELMRAFRELKDLPIDKIVEMAKKGIDLGYAKIEHHAEQKGRLAVYRTQVLKITLKNGNEFAFKIARIFGKTNKQDLPSSYRLKKDGKETIEHYIQIQFPNSYKYLVLMELSRLPLYDRYVEGLDKKIGSETDEKIKRALEIKKDLLESSKLMLQERAMELGITDAAAHNMFVRETAEGKPKIVFFDTGLEEGKPHFIND